MDAQNAREVVAPLRRDAEELPAPCCEESFLFACDSNAAMEECTLGLIKASTLN